MRQVVPIHRILSRNPFQARPSRRLVCGARTSAGRFWARGPLGISTLGCQLLSGAGQIFAPTRLVKGEPNLHPRFCWRKIQIPCGAVLLAKLLGTLQDCRLVPLNGLGNGKLRPAPATAIEVRRLSGKLNRAALPGPRRSSPAPIAPRRSTEAPLMLARTAPGAEQSATETSGATPPLTARWSRCRPAA
jgi:hypothetical protein